ncbi:MAG: hypothetical protein ACRC8Z_10500 [Empedobacter falsenii]
MERLKTFFKSKTWRIIWETLKLLISIPIFCVSVFYINKFLFSSNNKLFVFAGDTQGSYYSDFMFDRLLKSEPKIQNFGGNLQLLIIKMELLKKVCIV